jgi:dCTP deaminase
MTTLTDRGMRSRFKKGQLISDGLDVNRIRQACYELRASDIYYDLDDGHTRKVVGAEGTILLKPKQRVVLITIEKLDLPADVLGRVLTKGQLFSLGLLPVNTYADPGFQGRLGIVMVNASNDYLAIPTGTPIAKIEFVKLARPVEKPYSGQHGYETEIWPIQTNFRLKPDEIRTDKRIGDPLIELRQSYGPDFGRVVDRVFKHGRRLMVITVTYFVLMIGILALNFTQEDRLSVWLTLGLGVASSAGFSVLTWAAASFGRRR